MKIVFMGTPHAAVRSLERLTADGHQIAAVYTQPDRPAGRGNKIARSPVKEFAETMRFQVRQPTGLKSDDALADFKSLGADAAVVVAYGRILPQAYLDAFPLGAVNLHFSLLPKYRGAAPVNWAIVNGEKTTGVTTMRMDAGMDTGPILLQRSTAIGENENSIDLMERLALLGSELLSQTLDEIDSIRPQPQNSMQASAAPMLSKQDGLISWMLNAHEVTNRIRGFQPFPTAYTFFKGKKLTIWSARPEVSDGQIHQIGEIVTTTGNELTVYCGGDTMLNIEELQLEGKRRVAARDFINGVRLVSGTRLGDPF